MRIGPPFASNNFGLPFTHLAVNLVWHRRSVDRLALYFTSSYIRFLLSSREIPEALCLSAQVGTFDLENHCKTAETRGPHNFEGLGAFG